MALEKGTVDLSKFNLKAKLPFQLRIADLQMAMQDVYDFWLFVE